MPNKVQTVKQLQEHEKENTETAVAVVVTMITMKTAMRNKLMVIITMK